jgi:hypothetical protein
VGVLQVALAARRKSPPMSASDSLVTEEPKPEDINGTKPKKQIKNLARNCDEWSTGNQLI